MIALRWPLVLQRPHFGKARSDPTACVLCRAQRYGVREVGKLADRHPELLDLFDAFTHGHR